VIELRNVTKRFGDEAVVRDVSLALTPGTTTALIGPSGCGKSTLLRLMIGLLRADEGEAVYDGAVLDPSDGERLRAVRRRTGYAIQSGGLFPHLTARANVALPARRAGWSRERVRTRVDELGALMHLESGMLERFPSELSGGQRQRIALMRALVLDPEALLLDEPLGALDPVIRSHLQRELRALFDGLGKTVVLVTHDLAEAAYLARGDIVLMREGRIERRGSFDELRAEDADSYTGRFVGDQLARVAALASEAS